MIFRHLLNMRSHPTWVRGLKQNEGSRLDNANKSHPTWVRGLKLPKQILQKVMLRVAPYVGAWIETPESGSIGMPLDESHPTWVRGLKHNSSINGDNNGFVAPYVGAWIETYNYLE